MSATIKFVSRIPHSQRRALESLMFFNRYQDRVLEGIVDAVEHFGPPEIAGEDGYLRVRVSGLPGTQAVFAVDGESGEPLALAVFVRADFEHITVLHISVREDFASGGPRAGEQLLLRLMKELRRSTRRLKGVRHVDLYYGATRGSSRARTPTRRYG